MTREEAKELLPIIQAYAEGKEIQYRHKGRSTWYDLDSGQFNCDMYYYRIKPEPKYRPFKTQEECWNEMLKHQPFGWLRRNDTGAFAHISAVFPDFILFSSEKFIHKESFECYTFIDGAPFGIKEE